MVTLGDDLGVVTERNKVADRIDGALTAVRIGADLDGTHGCLRG